MVRRNHQPVRDAGQPAGGPARRDPDPEGEAPFEVALLGTIEFLPFILVQPARGRLGRPTPPPAVLIVGDLGRAISLASIPIAYELGILTIWQLYVGRFIDGVATVVFDVAYQSYLPSLVDRDQLVEGNSKLEVSRSPRRSGPGSRRRAHRRGHGARGDHRRTAVSFVASAFFVLLIRRQEPAPERHADEHGRPRGGMRKETMEGLRYVLTHPFLRSIAACTSSANLVGQFIFAILWSTWFGSLG